MREKIEPNRLLVTDYQLQGPRDLELAIYQTVRYYDIFEMPVTATQIWQCLLVEQENDEPRWGGRVHYTLPEVQQILRASHWLQSRLDTQWGYYALRGRKHLIPQRLVRHGLAQDKWKITCRASRLLAAMPFVRGLAGSGSLALDNTKPSSDLDLLVIAKAGRIWTARLFLLVALQLLGRRRKYWNEQAPNMVCLNHYVTDEHLTVPADIHNTYTAESYSHLVPIWGREMVHKFQEANGSWIRQHIMSPELPDVAHQYEVRLWRWTAFLKRGLEAVLLEPIGDMVERAAESIQRRIIRRHYQLSQPGRIVLSAQELAFHPDTKVPAILGVLHQDPGQKALL